MKFILRLNFMHSQQIILILPDSLNSTTITIHDELDTPNFAFAESQYIVSETNGTLGVVIRRYGDLTSSQTIRCITTSVTARGGLDFITLRSDSALSSVKFKPGMTTKAMTKRTCNVARI